MEGGCDGKVLRCGAGERHQQGLYSTMPVAWIGDQPPGCFIHVSITALLRSSSGYFKALHFWIKLVVSLLKIPHGVFRIKTAVAWPLQKRNGCYVAVSEARNGYKFITVI
jgi:hypothetical protein